MKKTHFSNLTKLAIFKKLAKLKLPVFFASLVLIIGYIFLPKPDLQDIDYSKLFFDKNANLLKMTLSPNDNYRIYTNLTRTNPDYIKAILLYEDKYFYYHFGINPISLLRSFWQSFVVKSRVYGGSTISMQVARMRFDLKTNKILGKLQQILIALELERHYSKQEILTAYINLLPFGGNIYGIEAASRIYFKKSAQNLNLLEALTLAVIPQNPNVRRPKLNQTNPELNAAQKNLMQIWQKKYSLNANIKNLAGFNLTISDKSQLPNFAPHLVNYLATIAKNTPANNMHTNNIHTSIDLKLQQALENIVKNYLAQKAKFGLKNASLLLVDAKTMQVQALVGSADFHNEAISGQIDGTLAQRSPGSSLKPFVYGLALQQGIIHPLSMLEDVPSSYGAYQPMNFDLKYRGLLNATQALNYSRNLPAVYLATRVKNPNLYEFLQSADADLKYDADYYGMGLVLGGAELTMRKIVELYASLLNSGFYAPLNYRKNAEKKPIRQILTPEAAFLVLDMLRKNTPPKGVNAIDNFKAFKTGTSYAYKDAWTIGIIGDYVLGVWLGNFDATGNHNLVGTSAAVPLWFRLASQINQTFTKKYAVKQNPNGALKLREVEICEKTGDLAGRYCPKQVKTWIIDGVSLLKVEDIFRKIKIDKKTGLRLCDYAIAPKATYDEKIFEFWSLDVLNLYKKAGIQIKQPPNYRTNCRNYAESELSQDLKIISPTNAKIAFNQDTGEAKILLKGLSRDAKKLYWFLDETYIGETKPEEVLVYKTNKIGKFVIRMLDDMARSSERLVEIENLPL